MSQSQFTEDGIYYRQWPASGETKAAVLLIHGLGEHCERYGALANALNTAGYALCSIDLPGHGNSEGPRGHIDNFDDYGTAALTLRQRMSLWYPDAPIYLLGHSMGGLIATHLLLQHQELFAGAMLSGAAIQSPQAPPGWQILLMKLIAMIAPKAGMLTLDASGISKDPAVVEKYMADPLVNKGKLSARFLVEMFRTMQQCRDEAAKITLPISIMHGSDDPMTAPEGSQLLHDSVSSNDREVTIYPDLMHEIFNEPEQQQVYADVIAWLDRHADPS